MAKHATIKSRRFGVNLMCDTNSETALKGRSSAGQSSGAVAQKSVKGFQQQSTCPAVTHVCRTLGSARKETKRYTYGSLVFGGLLFAAGAAPWLLPMLFVIFAVVCLPWRAASFYRQKWVFYLIDFCYFVNVATVIYLLFYVDVRFESLVYAMSDGPLAGALVAWQCPWVFGSAEHQVSVLMHLLPGLALLAHRYHTPTGLRGWRGMTGYLLQLLKGNVMPSGSVPQAATPEWPLLWLVVAPLVFYTAWQLLYFLIVQVLFRSYIKRHGYDTSYTCLARRAAKTNNFWNRLVRRGSITRRILMYGLLQLLFTVICILVFLPTYNLYMLAFLLQVVKIVFPVYYGSRYQMTKVPQHVFLKGMQVYQAVKADADADTHVPSAAAEHRPSAPQTAVVQHSAVSGIHLRSCAAEVVSAHYDSAAPFRSQAVA